MSGEELVRVVRIEYGRVFSLPGYRNERITLHAEVDLQQEQEEEPEAGTAWARAAALLFRRVHLLHSAFQHYRHAQRQLRASYNLIDSRMEEVSRLKDIIKERRLRALTEREEGRPKRAECILEELPELEEKLAQARDALQEAHNRSRAAAERQRLILSALNRGDIEAALKVRLDPELNQWTTRSGDEWEDWEDWDE